MNNTVTYSAAEAHAIIAINNGKVNAISHEVIDGLNEALDQAEAAKKVVILTGKEGILSAGFDLKTMTASADAAKALVMKGSQLVYRMLSFPLPIIGACNGHAIAKGAFLLLGCDYRIGVEGDFKIGLNEVQIGMTMHHAGIAMAKARLSPVYVDRSVINAELYKPQDAITAGFLDIVVPPTHLEAAATKIAGLFAQLKMRAHAETKLKVRKQILEGLKEAIALDSAAEIVVNG
jgi:enoyl-CoA hydratase